MDCNGGETARNLDSEKGRKGTDASHIYSCIIIAQCSVIIAQYSVIIAQYSVIAVCGQF